MKFLIGILYSGESQFEACKASIHAQSHTDWEIVEIKHLSLTGSHQALFRSFMENADKFDAFIKIDADMELCHKDYLKTLSDYFTKHTHIDHVSMKVDDFFTARLIWGLNAFRSNVVFALDHDDIYIDKAASIEDGAKAKLKRHRILVPAAYHGYNPDEYQSFYFGCHKAVKVMYGQSRSHMRNIRRLPFAALQRRDSRPLTAYAGAAMAFEQQLQQSSLDHGNTEIRRLFDDQYLTQGSRGLSGLIKDYKAVGVAKARYLSSLNYS